MTWPNTQNGMTLGVGAYVALGNSTDPVPAGSTAIITEDAALTYIVKEDGVTLIIEE